MHAYDRLDRFAVRHQTRQSELADDRIEFLGRQPDKIVNYYAARCQALLFPGEEDFGMVPLEVMLPAGPSSHTEGAARLRPL